MKQKVSDIKKDHICQLCEKFSVISKKITFINFARNFLMSDLIGKKLEGNLALNKPIAFNQTIMTTGGNFHFTVNPMLIIVHIALFVECSRTTAREI